MAARSPTSATMHSSFDTGSAIGLASVRRRCRQSLRNPLRSAVPIAPAAPVIRMQSVFGSIIVGAPPSQPLGTPRDTLHRAEVLLDAAFLRCHQHMLHASGL